jgi:hypothetical protein
MLIDAVRQRLRSLAHQATSLDNLLGDVGLDGLDLGELEQAKVLLRADRLLQRLEQLADLIGAAVDPLAVRQGGQPDDAQARAGDSS